MLRKSSHAPRALDLCAHLISFHNHIRDHPIFMQTHVPQNVVQSVHTMTNADNKNVQSSPNTSCSPSPQPGPSNTPGLHSLVDGEPNERPPYSNFTLVKYAILGSPNQRLTLSEIYLAIATRFPWFQSAGKGWKNSVRHCLSLDTQFQKEPRPATEPGKGCYWTVALDTPRGNKRERKRNKKPTKRDVAAEFARLHADPPSSFPLTTPAFRDYGTTVPVQVHVQPPTSVPGITRTPSHPPAQSGWTPYFPTAMMAAPMPMALRGHYTEVAWQDSPTPPDHPGTQTFCTLSPSEQEMRDGEEDEGDESDAGDES